jgi:hypothetical protein
MRSAATAIGWEMWARNRVGATTIAAGVLLFALVNLLTGVNLEPSRMRGEVLFVWSIILFAVAFLYLVSVAVYGDLRQGSFNGLPTRMFTLPIATSRLVLWPMVYGQAAMIALWVATTLFVWLPARADVQWWVLPLLCVALAWFQAIAWAVPGSAWAKVIAACIILPALKFALEMVALGVAWLSFENARFDRSEILAHRVLTLIIFCGSALPLAYGAAVWGVARARRGTSSGFAWLARSLDMVSAIRNRRKNFRSPEGAQFWLECRRTGLVLPLFVVGFLMFVSVVAAPFTPAIGHLILLIVLACLTPFVAVLAGYLTGKAGAWGGDLALSSFQATRPLSCSALATVKIRAAAWSAGFAWILFAFLAPLWLSSLGTAREVTRMLEPLFVDFNRCQFAGIVMLVLVGLWGLTWGQAAAVLTLTITGRGWIVNFGVVLYLVVTSLLIVIGRMAYVVGPEEFERLMRTATWCACVLLALKLFATVWALVDGRRAGLLTTRDLAVPVGMWVLGTSSLVALVLWQVPTEGLPVGTVAGGTSNRLSAEPLALMCVLAMPLARLIAAPRALSLNRIR